MTIYIAIARKDTGQELFVKHDTDLIQLEKTITTSFICREDVSHFDLHQVTSTGIVFAEKLSRCAEFGFFPCGACERLGHRHCTACGVSTCNEHSKPHPRKFIAFLCPSCFAQEQAEIKRLVEETAALCPDMHQNHLRQWVATRLASQDITPKLVAEYLYK